VHFELSYQMMDLQVGIFLLIFLSLSSLATIGICFVEIRSCWRQYRLKVETKKLRKLNILDENEELAIDADNECVIGLDADPSGEMDQNQSILYSTGCQMNPSAPLEHHEHVLQPEDQYSQPTFHNQIEEVYLNNHQLIYHAGHHRLPHPRSQGDPRQQQHLGAFV